MNDSAAQTVGPVAVSVIIPVRNAEQHLASLLECLTRQSVAAAWEVVAVDNRSTDQSRQIAEGYATSLPLRVVEADAMANPSYARNVGAATAIGDKLVFIDADDEIDDGYVSAMSQALDAHDLVTSRVDSVSLNPEWVQGAHGPPWQSDHVAAFFGFLPAAGVNIGIRRGLLDRLGGFPEKFSGSEDVAFSWRAGLAGTPIHLVPAAVYRYRYRQSMPELYRQAVNWGRDNVLLYRTFREHGMPSRRMRDSGREWLVVARGLLQARHRATRAPLVVRLGFCVGRLKGSPMYRVLYL